MLKKKSTQKPQKHDFTALDAAVSELSKQTEALLGSAEPKPSKPILPKKKSIPHTKGKSFDIIQNSSSKKPRATSNSTLKTAQVTHHNVAPIAHEPALLSDHATKSYNEKSEDTVFVDAPAKVTVSKVEHHTAPLTFLEPDQATEVIDKSSSSEESPIVTSTQTAKSTLSFEEDEPTEESEPANLHKKDEAPVEETTNNVILEKPTEDAESNTAEKEVEPPAFNSGELFANNLVKDHTPRGYKPDENQQKPTVFDTNEYHVELHDWSKLENHNGSRWVLLTLLLLVAAGLVYFVFSGQKLPF